MGKLPKKQIFVYPKEVQDLTGRGARYSSDIIQAVTLSLGKEKHQAVTYIEVAAYLEVAEGIVFRSINTIPIIDLDATG